jgi:hypothetical protein
MRRCSTVIKVVFADSLIAHTGMMPNPKGKTKPPEKANLSSLVVSREAKARGWAGRVR